MTATRRSAEYSKIEEPRPMLLTPFILAAQGAPAKMSTAFRAIRRLDDNAWLAGRAMELLPQRAEWIMAPETEMQRTKRFIEAFEEEYFPIEGEIFEDMYLEEQTWNGQPEGLFTGSIIPDWEWNYDPEDTPIGMLSERIPTISLGVVKENLHYIWDAHPLGHCMMFLLSRPEEYDWDTDEGMWTAWVEEAASIHSAPEETLQLLPQGGYRQPWLRRALRGTPFKNVIPAVAWVSSSTGMMLTDIGDQVMELGQPFDDTWELETVLYIREAWQEAQTIMEATEKLRLWLEEGEPWENFRQMVKYINGRQQEFPEDSNYEHWEPQARKLETWTCRREDSNR